MRRKRWRGELSLVLLLLLAAVVAAYGYHRGALLLPFGPGPEAPEAAGIPAPAGAPTRPAVRASGTGQFEFASVDGPVAGTGGSVLDYRVAVEDGLGVPAAQFGANVEAILSDPRSWTAGGTIRFHRVAGDEPSDFTIYLASPVLSEQMCREDGLHTEQFTNCRLSDDRVVINSARWLTGVPDYGAPLAEYRAYAINHEVGHELGHQHELCPGPGLPAPVMQQQTLGLDGCVAYAWPYRNGVRYTGPPADPR
jgi:hypothetical protein